MNKYLIIGDEDPFFTNYYTKENCWKDNIGMLVIDIKKGLFTEDGSTWKEVEEDNL